MRKRIKLGELLKRSEIGIFGTMYDLHIPLPWLTGQALEDAGIIVSNDLDYSLGHSYNKLISPLVTNMLDDNGTLDVSSAQMLANIIKIRYLDKWARIWQSIHLEYNPLNNYDMTEAMTDDETVREYGKTETRTPTLTHTKTGTETNTPDVTETETPELTRTDKVRGFNSSEDVPSGSASSSGTKTTVTEGENEIEYNITEEDTGTDETVLGGSDTQTRNYSLSFTGRVGNFSPSEMLEKELAFREFDYFNKVVFADVDKLLTLSIY